MYIQTVGYVKNQNILSGNMLKEIVFNVCVCSVNDLKFIQILSK